eukprot:110136-Prymnesium_polylepis.1
MDMHGAHDRTSCTHTRTVALAPIVHQQDNDEGARGRNSMPTDEHASRTKLQARMSIRRGRPVGSRMNVFIGGPQPCRPVPHRRANTRAGDGARAGQHDAPRSRTSLHAHTHRGAATRCCPVAPSAAAAQAAAVRAAARRRRGRRRLCRPRPLRPPPQRWRRPPWLCAPKR